MPDNTTRKSLTKQNIAGIIIGILVLAGVVALALHQAGAPVVQHGRHFGSGDTVSAAVAIAQKNDVPVIKEELGTVTPLTNVVVRTQIAGYLTQVAFQEGQIIHKDDFLAEIDPRPYQLALENAQGAYTRDQALLKEAQLNLQRYKKLVAEDSISVQTLDTQAALVQQYIGTLQTDQAAIDQAKLNLAYCHITSPVTGRIGLRQVDVGNYVQASDTNGLVTITQLQPMTVLFTVAEDDLPAIMKRVNDNAELQTTAYDRTHSTKLATGKLVSIDNQIDVTTGTVKLRAEFDNSDYMLFPNQFVNIDLLVDTMPGLTTVPSSAIQRGAPGTFVYLVKDDDTVSVRPVKLGPDGGITASITDGLAPGDKVVTDGLDKLRDGSKITIPAEKKNKSGDDGKTDTGTPKSGKHGKDAKDKGSKNKDSEDQNTKDAEVPVKPATSTPAPMEPSPAAPSPASITTTPDAETAPNSQAAPVVPAPTPGEGPTDTSPPPPKSNPNIDAPNNDNPSKSSPGTPDSSKSSSTEPNSSEGDNNDDGTKVYRHHKKKDTDNNN